MIEIKSLMRGRKIIVNDIRIDRDMCTFVIIFLTFSDRLLNETLKVVLHSVLNGLNHEDSAIK